MINGSANAGGQLEQALEYPIAALGSACTVSFRLSCGPQHNGLVAGATSSIDKCFWRGPGGAVETRPPNVIVVCRYRCLPSHMWHMLFLSVFFYSLILQH